MLNLELPDYGFNDWAVFQRVNGLKFKLAHQLEYFSRVGEWYVVRPGYVSDLGSVPRWLWPLLPPHEFPSAYFLHDWLYSSHKVNRQKADLLLAEALIASNAPQWKAEIIYLGVHLFGAKHYA